MSDAKRFQSAISIASCGLTIVMLLLIGGQRPAEACTTPVFRYAMYRWPPSPYYVFYMHRGEVAEEDEAVNKSVAEAFDAKVPANVTLQTIDVTQKERFDRLPSVVRKVWETKAEEGKPLHVVFSSWGIEQFAGRLDSKQLAAMIDSPARKKLGKLFDDGSAVVLLMLTGPDEKANKRAEKVVGEVVAMAAGGEIPVSGAEQFYPIQPVAPEEPQKPGNGSAEGDQQEDSTNVLKLGVLKLSRTDPKEAWLVRMLLSVEPDLHEFPKEPMVFTVYGRGRAMPPYLAKGITKDNIAECVAFLAASCSCMVKDQNPGMDLLMKKDWDATAEIMAKDDPELNADPWGYQEFEPDDSGSSGTTESSPDTPAEKATPAEEDT